MSSSILILSGPVGAGKTAVSRELVRQLGADVVLIEGDVFWSFLVKGGAQGRTPQSFRTVMASMTAAAIPFGTGAAQVILDFSMPPWFLPTAKAIAATRQRSLDYVVLRPSEQVCAERARTRTEGRIADYAPYRDLYHAFDDVVAAHLLAEDEASAEQIAADILRGAADGRFRLA